MSFSTRIPNTFAAFSPNGKYVASTSQQRLIISDSQDMQKLYLYNCHENISQIEWSHDSEFVLCVVPATHCVQVWCVSDSLWKCKISEGVHGVSSAFFAHQKNEVLVLTDFSLKLSVWSILSSNTASLGYVRTPKNGSRCVDFSGDGKFLAVVERKEANRSDVIYVINTDNWKCVNTFCAETMDLQEVKWSPNSRYLCVVDSPILEYTLKIFSPDGSLLVNYSPFDKTTSLSTANLGIKKIKWNNAGSLLGIGSFDSVVRVLNPTTWSVVCELHHSNHLENPETAVFHENREEAKFEIVQMPLELKMPHPLIVDDDVNAGVSILEWSDDGKFLCTKVDEFPCVLWVWNIAKLHLSSAVILKNEIKSVKWSPSANRLAICSGIDNFYLWTVDGISCVQTEMKKINQLNWRVDGKTLLLRDPSSFCCLYV